MLVSMRTGAIAALCRGVAAVVTAAVCGLLLVASPAFAADKPFQRDDLGDNAIRLEARIKKDAAPATRSLPAIRRDVDAALRRSDFGQAKTLLEQVLAAQPDEAATWLRYANVLYRGYTTEPDPRRRQRISAWMSDAATAAYIAYQRASGRDDEADSLALLSQTYADRKIWRPALDTLKLSLDLREVTALRTRYERLREDHGFRMLDYSVDSDAASPRACIQFSEALPAKRVDFSPYVSVGGIDKPALSVDDRQLCVEGLKHGERYAVTLRAGLPSVKEALLKPAELSLYVRDRKPFVHFAGKAYVLPRSGQRGIPIVSVNTRAVGIEIYRVGDRNLIETVLGGDFQRNLNGYEFERLKDERGAKVWSGELAVDSTLNTDVTTAFPVGEAVGDLAPGVYVMSAAPKAAPGANEADYRSVATQWFIVSDLGLTAFSGVDGIHVFVNSLASTAPKDGIPVRLMARNNEVLATRTTDAHGHAHFEIGLTRGEGGLAPALLVAGGTKGADYAFLSLKSPAFDLSDRGVAGRPVANGLDAFVYTERGVYRSGETVYVTALLRDGRGQAAVGVPLTLVVQRPDGVEYRRSVVPDQGVGGHSLTLPINAAAPTGTWRVQAFTDPKGAAVGDTTFLVEDYVPDRLEFDLAAPAGRIAPSAPADLTLAGRYLYGAPASHLTLDGEVVVKLADGRPGYDGYQFGLTDEEVTAERQPLADLPETDADGKARFTVALDKVPAVARPLEAEVTVRLAESGGRAVERKITLPVTPAARMIGVKPLFAGRSLGEGENATFDVVMVAPDGSRQAAQGLRYELQRIETRYQWYRRDNNWNYEPIKRQVRVADGSIDLTAGAPARLSLPVQFGRYRLDVSTADPNGPVTSISFDAGWYAEASADTPDLLEIALDQPGYSAGDTMTVAVTARTAGRLTLNVIGNRFVTPVETEVKAGQTELKVPVGSDWGSGAYLVATLRRPLDVEAKRMPGRAIGLKWFSIDRKARTLDVALAPPAVIRPDTTLHVPVKIAGLAAGDDARVVVAAVDVGILNLTNYKPPAPDQYYLGQRRLGAEIRDLYGQLIDGMQGVRGQIRTGGDAAPAALDGSPPVQKPVSLYSGIVTVGPDGTADVAFEVPAFAGTLRVMAVAWSKGRVGRANTDVTVRDPVVVTATLPRFLRNGDTSQLRIEIDNVEGPAGDYSLTVSGEGPLTIGEGATRTVTLAARQRQALTIPISAAAAGTGQVNVSLGGPNGFSLARGYALDVNPATQILTRRNVQTVAKGQSLTLSKDMFADLVPGTGTVSVSVGLSSALDAATILQALDRYPYGCTEQTVSRALPLLYVNELAGDAHLALDDGVDERIRGAIDRVLARQSSNGSFGLWSAGGDDPWLDAYVADFLTRARERNFAVPDVAFRLALDRLRNTVGNAPDVAKSGGVSLAYALYVLARNGQAPIGDLRYIADARVDDLRTPIAKAQIAAALAMLGDRTRAERVYAAALAAIPRQPALEPGRRDFGSVLRDSAALVTLASEGGAPKPTVFGAVQRVEAARPLTSYTSTQENAWMLLAARAIAKDAESIRLRVGDTPHQGVLTRSLRASAVTAPLTISNEGATPVEAVVSVSGAPLTPEPAAERGFKIERLTYTLDGQPIDISSVKQNQRIVVVLRMTEPKPEYGRVLVADYLPAGFEIDNPKLVSSGQTGTLSWITDAAEPTHSEFRDDRFTAAFTRSSGARPVFTVAYVVRAVSPGHYVLPQAYVEDMYRPDRFGRTATGAVDVTAAQ